MSPEGKARNRAHQALYGLTREELTPGAPAFERARAQFQARVLPTYHFLFDEVANELRDGTLTAQEAARRSPMRSFVFSVIFLVVILGTAVVVAQLVHPH